MATAEQLAQTILKSTKPRPPLCADCHRLIPNAIVYEKIESIIKSMMVCEESGLNMSQMTQQQPTKQRTLSTSSLISSSSSASSLGKPKTYHVFTGSDLIQWLREHLELEPNSHQEAAHLANLIASYGYIFPLDQQASSASSASSTTTTHSNHHQPHHHHHHHHLHLHLHSSSTHNHVNQAPAFQVRNDNTLYCFQAPCLWPSNWEEPETFDYAIYLCKRIILNQKQNVQHTFSSQDNYQDKIQVASQHTELADYELETLGRLQRVYSAKWARVSEEAWQRLELERQSPSDRLQLRLLEMQERAFWAHFKPFPGCVSGRELDMKKLCRLSKVSRNCLKCRQVSLANEDTKTTCAGAKLMKSPLGAAAVDTPANEPSAQIANDTTLDKQQPAANDDDGQAVQGCAAIIVQQTSGQRGPSGADDNGARPTGATEAACHSLLQTELSSHDERLATSTISLNAAPAAADQSASDGPLMHDSGTRQESDAADHDDRLIGCVMDGDRESICATDLQQAGAELAPCKHSNWPDSCAADLVEPGSSPKVNSASSSSKRFQIKRQARMSADWLKPSELVCDDDDDSHNGVHNQLLLLHNRAHERTHSVPSDQASLEPEVGGLPATRSPLTSQRGTRRFGDLPEESNDPEPSPTNADAHPINQDQQQPEQQQQDHEPKTQTKTVIKVNAASPFKSWSKSCDVAPNQDIATRSSQAVAGSLLNYDGQRMQLSPAMQAALLQPPPPQRHHPPAVSIRKSSFDLVFGRSNNNSQQHQHHKCSSSSSPSSSSSSSSFQLTAHHQRPRLSVSLASSSTSQTVASALHNQRKGAMLNQQHSSFFGSLISWRQRSESKGDIGKLSSSLRSHLRVGGSSTAPPTHHNPTQPLGQQQPAFFSASFSSPVTPLSQSDTSREFPSDTPTSKAQKIMDSYVSFARQWADYDPFLTQPLPSNPWLTDSGEFWEAQQQTKEVNTRRIKRWAFSLRELLQDPAGRNQLSLFLEKEFSAENLKFWEQVQQLKRVRLSQVAQLVESIWAEYLAPDANWPINIDSKSFEATKQKLERCKQNRNLYDEAANHVYLLMRNDSYPRYLRSDMYKDYLRLASSLEKINKKPRSQIQVSFDVFKSQALRQRFNSVAR